VVTNGWKGVMIRNHIIVTKSDDDWYYIYMWIDKYDEKKCLYYNDKESYEG